MTTRTLVLTTVLIAAGSGPMLAQPPKPPTLVAQPGQPGQAPRARTGAQTPEPMPPPPPPAPPVAASRRNGQPVNVKIEFTITDQRGGSPAVKRSVTVVVADAQSGQIRSQSEVVRIGSIPLNVDTTPELLTDGKIRLGFNLMYDWAAVDSTEPTPPRGTVTKTTMHDIVSLILENGKSMVAAQSADPIGDRQVTVEVKATILK
jgi:hypothetical protein